STLFFMLEGEDIFNLIVTITLAIISLIFSLVAIIGAIKMRNPQNKAWGYIASLLMIVPTLANCCLIGIPIGIWGIVAVKKSTTT
ncbi:MAG: hypothetical protein KDK34_12740, partial [Leptospiraceae bacterium]|nr:hypothetical protein [Leptospiraceae bacterium]